jgi:predicted amidohydrolase
LTKTQKSMTLKVAAAQYPITYHQSLEAWRKSITAYVQKAAKQGTQLLLFPEYGSLELASLLPANSQADIQLQVQQLQAFLPDFCQILSNLSQKHQLIIVAPSFAVQMQGQVYNRVYVFGSKGLAGYQEKFFMTRFEAEHWGISSAAKELSVFEASWGSFGVQICYDVEFPIGSQLLCAAGAQLILAPSCTETLAGATRVHVGARARALEGQCYSLVSQTIGNASWNPAVDINYGYAAAYCPPDHGLPATGIVAQKAPQKPGWLWAELDFDKINMVRSQGQVLNYQDMQHINSEWLGQKITLHKVLV